MKNSRPRIKYSQTPHSISRRIETLSNKTAAALLSLINRKTVGFGQGFVDLAYSQISRELNVTPRTISRAAKTLEHCGDIVRQRVSQRVYRWKIVLQQDEIIEDPRGTFLTKAPNQTSQVRTDRSGPCGQIDPDGPDNTVRTQTAPVEHHKPLEIEPRETPVEQKKDPLKKLIKDKYLKKHHGPVWCTAGAPDPKEDRVSGAPPVHQTQPAPPNDDEPLYKSCLKRLLAHGISQRLARKLCREHSHQLIHTVLEHAPQRPGIKNLPAYIISEIKDGGYLNPSASEVHRRCTTGAPPVHQNRNAANTAPITYRTVQQTQAELQTIEKQKLQQEQAYQQKGRQLLERYKTLPEDLKLRLKLAASLHLTQILPTTGNREQMLRDQTFQRLANRTVLEHYFHAIDQGQSPDHALTPFETNNKAA